MKVNLLLICFHILLLILAGIIKFSRIDELILNASLTLKLTRPMINADRHHASAVLYISDSITSN
jgi:hypothetical protein